MDCFLKLDGIRGDATDMTYKEWIEVLGYEWSYIRKTPTSKPTFANFHFKMRPNRASPVLASNGAMGKRIASAICRIRRSGSPGGDMLEWKLSDCVVMSFETKGGHVEGTEPAGVTWVDVPVDQVELNFAKIEWSYFQPSGAAVKGSWDLKAGKGT
jgi:type VI secretion system secreted protein Hcp